MAKKKTTEGELIPADTKPKWIVSSSEPDIAGRQVHRLLYGKRKMHRGTTPGVLRRFNELAEFCNARGLEPRPAVQCLADTNLPAPPKRKPAEATASDHPTSSP